jgi:ABC-2 type transport system ATP-binding protein
VLERVELVGQERKLAGQLSGGNKQRLALAAAIAHHPELLFLDEPTAGVDPLSRRNFWRIIHDLSRSGLTVFATTHYMDEAEYCHRLGFFAAGRLLALGTPTEIKLGDLGGVLLELACEPMELALHTLSTLSAVRRVTPFGDRLRLLVSDAAALDTVREALLASGSRIETLCPTQPSLEDVYISLIEHRPRGDDLTL